MMSAFAFCVASIALLFAVLAYDIYDRWRWARLRRQANWHKDFNARVEARRKHRRAF